MQTTGDIRAGGDGVDQAYRIEAWQTLYSTLCGASAALAGLLFIATSVHIQAIAKIEGLRIRAAANTFLIMVLVAEAGFVLLPQHPAVLGAEICLSAALILAAFIWARRGLHRTGRRINRRGWVQLLLVAIGIAGGVSLAVRWGGGMFLVTTQFFATVGFVMFNAYSLLMAAEVEEDREKIAQSSRA